MSTDETLTPKQLCMTEFKLLDEVLTEALRRAESGTGIFESSSELMFEHQPMIAVAEMLGSDHGLAQQVILNVRAAVACDDPTIKVDMLLDAMLAIAGMVVYSQRNDVHEPN